MPADGDSGFRVPCGQADESDALTYVSTDEPGIARRRAGRGFVYSTPDRRRITDAEMIRRIRALVIPPAWRDVWICANARGHIQAFGFDGRGRRQYRYHPSFRHLREGAKFDHLLTFAEALPDLRRQVAADMAAPGLGRHKVLATVVHLLETTMIRVGNKTYAKDNGSYGLTTLHSGHVQVEGAQLRFEFRGKSGKFWRLAVRDRRVAKTVRACQHLPGQHLFAYVDAEGHPQSISSADVNAYLKQATGREITAKDFRTWAGTVLAALALAGLGPAETRARATRALREVIKEVAGRLGNTPTVCRASYIHPEIIDAFLTGDLALDLDADNCGQVENPSELRPDEKAVISFLHRRLRPRPDYGLSDQLRDSLELGQTLGGD